MKIYLIYATFHERFHQKILAPIQKIMKANEIISPEFHLFFESHYLTSPKQNFRAVSNSLTGIFPFKPIEYPYSNWQSMLFGKKEKKKKKRRRYIGSEHFSASALRGGPWSGEGGMRVGSTRRSPCQSGEGVRGGGEGSRRAADQAATERFDRLLPHRLHWRRLGLFEELRK